MAAPNSMSELVAKLHDFEKRLIEIENRLTADEQDIKQNKRAIRANKEKGWFAYDKTIELDLRVCDLEEAEDCRDE